MTCEDLCRTEVRSLVASTAFELSHESGHEEELIPEGLSTEHG